MVQPLKDLGPEVDLLAPMPYTVFQSLLDASAPRGLRGYWRGEYMRGLPDEAIATFLRLGPPLAEVGFPFSQMVIFRIGQGVARTPDGATAFSHRDADYLFHPISVWSDPADDERLIAGNRVFAEAMRPYSTGASYLNFTTEPDRVRAAFGDEKYRRLVAIKDRYDPDNLFRMNQNVKPSSQAGALALT